MTDRAASLEQLVRNELATIPIEQWGYFFPFLVALWRYIESEHPSSLGELRCGYDSEPYFEGPNAAAFMHFVNAPHVFAAIERLGYAAASDIPEAAHRRGFVVEQEVPLLPQKEFLVLVNAVESFA